MDIHQLDTPAAVVDLDKLEAAIQKCQNYLDRYGLDNRPHIKTHKIPDIAHMQIKAGAVGITCQKLGEAEIMAQAGIQDIFIPYNIIGPAKLERLMDLARRVRLSVTVDNEFVARNLSTAFRSAKLTLPVLVECDTGGKRCGVQSPQAAAEMARFIQRQPGLVFGGFMTYPNNDGLDLFMRESKRLLAKAGISVERVSGGGTSCLWQAHTHPELTEHRAGMYIFGDRSTMKAGAVQLEDCSFKVITTVVSRPTDERGILDGGSKTFSSDLVGLEGYGMILEYPDARIYSLMEEHGLADFSMCRNKPGIGERVTVIPNHCCAVTNLFTQVYGVRKDQVEVTWPVAARGAIQ